MATWDQVLNCESVYIPFNLISRHYVSCLITSVQFFSFSHPNLTAHIIFVWAIHILWELIFIYCLIAHWTKKCNGVSSDELMAAMMTLNLLFFFSAKDNNNESHLIACNNQNRCLFRWFSDSIAFFGTIWLKW